MIARATQPLEQPPRVGIVHIRGNQRVQSATQPENAARVLLQREVRPLAQANTIAQQSPQRLRSQTSSGARLAEWNSRLCWRS